MINDLNSIFYKNKTDKYNHKFGIHYDLYLKPFREKFLNILEIGIYKGDSLLSWNDYFSNATIYGVDIEKFWDDGVFQNRPKISPMLLNLENEISPINLNEYDLIVDDASHTMQNQHFNLTTLWKFLKPGGFYILEDLHTSWSEVHYSPGYPKMTDTIYQIIKNEHPLSNEIEFVNLISNRVDSSSVSHCSSQGMSTTCVIRKKQKTIEDLLELPRLYFYDK